MVDLIAFLNARLDEDEAIAKPLKHSWVTAADAQTAAFSYRFDAKRILRDVAAKREILDACLEVGATDQKPPKVPDYIRGVIVGQGDALRGIVRILAAVYSDHPDYRQEWAS